MADPERRERARARAARIVLHRTRVQSRELDLDPIRGEAAISLLSELTRESWAAARLPIPDYTRHETPVRFVPRRR